MVLRFFLFAGVFLFISCTEFERNHPDDPGGVNYQGKSTFPSSSAQNSSSSAEFSSPGTTSSSSLSVAYSSSSLVSLSSSSKPSSSSSILPSSSSDLCAGFVNGTKREHYGKEKEQFCDSRDGKKYVYVTIDTQTWMAENLGYDASGSCYKNDPANCVKYGRLYGWTTAMNLQPSCERNSCSVNAKHRGICPSGWHIPSDAEWTTLTDFIGANAGTELKAESAWNSYYSTPSGSDTYGFAALPGGPGGGSYFESGIQHSYEIGEIGNWWSATGNYSDYAYFRRISFDKESIKREFELKSYVYSVRCAKD